MVDEDTSELIARIYAGAHEREKWNLAMESIGDRMRAAFVMVATVQPRASAPTDISYHHVQHNRLDDAAGEYASEMYQYDPTLRHVSDYRTAAHFDSLDLVSATEYDSHPYVRWNWDRCGSKYWKMVHRTLPGGTTLGMAVHRGAELGPLSQTDGQLLQVLFSHMVNASDLAAVPLLLNSAEPSLLVNGHAELITYNEGAVRLLRQASAIRFDRGRLGALDRESDGALKAAIASAATQAIIGGAPLDTLVPIRRGSGRPALLARITSLPRPAIPFSSVGAAALVRIVDPEEKPKSTGVIWKAAFGFTAAENRLVEDLVNQDGSLRDTAGRLGIAYGTARIHLARVFSKAGVNTQAGLIRLLSRLGG